ncbi:MAG: winged helix-turn-helix domain-containing protein [Gammaproteobacteria bacterium]
MEKVVAENEAPDRGDALRKGFRLGDWTVRPIEGLIKSPLGERHLQPKSMDVLLCLACAANEIVERDEIIERVWGRTAVTDEPLTRCIHEIRRELCDTRDHPTYIQTIPKRGYRLIAPVEEVETDATQSGVFPVLTRTPAGDPVLTGRFLLQLPRRRAVQVAVAFSLIASAALAAILTVAAPDPTFEDLPGVSAEVRSIAVLPFEMRGEDVAMDWLGNGLAEDLLILLAEVDGLEVAARTSSFRHFPSATDVVQVGHDLNVHYVLKGSVERDDDVLSISVRLIDAQTRHRLWGQSYQRPAREWFEVQRGIARQVAAALLPVSDEDQWVTPPTFDRPGIAVAPTSSVEAYDYHLQARQLLRRSRDPEALGMAAEYFARAIQLDGGFAQAHAGLCTTFVRQLDLDALPELIEPADEVCRRGVALHPDSVDTHLALADLHRASGRAETAIDEYRWVIERRPRAAAAYLGLAAAYAGLGAEDRAEHAYRRAIEARPDYERSYDEFASYLFARGRYGEVLDQARRMIQLDADSLPGYTALGDASLSSGRFTAAIAAYREVIMRAPDVSTYSRLGASLYYLGRYPAAVTMYQRAAELTPRDHRVWADLGDAYLQIAGGGDQAADAYRRARELIEAQLDGGSPAPADRIRLAYYCAALGDGACAWQNSTAAVDQAPAAASVHYLDALVNLRLGQEAAAVTAVERAWRLGYPRALLTADPQLTSVRNHPRLSGMFLARRTLSQPANFPPPRFMTLAR